MRLEMEGETRKRKIAIMEEDEEDEDMKIDKFFALIRSAKDIRDQLLDAQGSKSYARAKKVPVPEKKTEAVRVPRKPSSFLGKAPAEDTVDSLAASSGGGVGGGVGGGCGVCCGGSSGTARVTRSLTEEKSNRGESSKNKFDGGRIFLDLNLSL